jgi:hypothetical protein
MECKLLGLDCICYVLVAGPVTDHKRQCINVAFLNDPPGWGWSGPDVAGNGQFSPFSGDNVAISPANVIMIREANV